MSHPDTGYQMHYAMGSPPWPYTLADADTFVNRQLETVAREERIINFAIRDPNGDLIGIVGLLHPRPSLKEAQGKEDDGPNTMLELGYWVDPDYWGRGIIPAAAREVLRVGFEEVGAERVVAAAFVENAGM